MKKIILLICLFSIFELPVFSENDSKQQENINSKQLILISNGKNYLLETFTGEYYLLGYRVNIKLKEYNKLVIIFGDLPLTKNLKSKTSFSYDKAVTILRSSLTTDAITFPYKNEYELVPIGGLTFILKNSGGFSIEFKQPIEKKDENILLRDVNASILNKDDFVKIIEKKEYPSLFNNQLEEKNEPYDKKAYLKENMNIIHSIVETFPVDWGGYYSKNISSLIQESTKKSYWKDIINPYTLRTGENEAIMDYKKYKYYKLSSALKGLVIYEPIKCKYDESYKIDLCLSYKIYGTDETGNLIQENNTTFYFSNQY